MLAVIGLLIVAAFLGIEHFANSTNSASVTTGSASSAANALDLRPQPFTSKLMSFNYPKLLKPITPSPLVGPDREKASFIYKDVTSWDLEVDVLDNYGKPLTSDSSYAFRQQHPEIYKQTILIEAGRQVTVMSDSSAPGFAKVAFFDSGSLRAEVSLVGDDPAGLGPLNTTFNMVLASWRWR